MDTTEAKRLSTHPENASPKVEMPAERKMLKKVTLLGAQSHTSQKGAGYEKSNPGAWWDAECLLSGHCWASPWRRLRPDPPAKGSCLMEEGTSHSRVTMKGQKLRRDAKGRGGLIQHGAPGRPPNSTEEGAGSDTTGSRKKWDSNG